MNVPKKFALLLALCMMVLLAGCSIREIDRTFDTVENSIEQKLDQVENKVENSIKDAVYPDVTLPAPDLPETQLSAEEAQAIALQHAELTADQVSGLRVEFEIDNRVPHYDVQFYQDQWEYEYEIHGETGDILSYDRDL